MLKNQKNNQVYFKIIIPIILIIVLIVLALVFRNKDSSSSDSSNFNNLEIIVRDATELDTPSNQNSSNSNSSSQNLGPATIEDLGGATGSSNLDQLLEGKEINIGE